MRLKSGVLDNLASVPLATEANVRQDVFTFPRAALDAVTFTRFRTTHWSGRRYMTPHCPNVETQRRDATAIRLPSIKPSGLVTPVRTGRRLRCNVNEICPTPTTDRPETTVPDRNGPLSFGLRKNVKLASIKSVKA